MNPVHTAPTTADEELPAQYPPQVPGLLHPAGGRVPSQHLLAPHATLPAPTGRGRPDYRARTSLRIRLVVAPSSYRPAAGSDLRTGRERRDEDPGAGNTPGDEPVKATALSTVGAAVDGANVTGTVQVKADNVHITNATVHGKGAIAIQVFHGIRGHWSGAARTPAGGLSRW